MKEHKLAIGKYDPTYLEVCRRLGLMTRREVKEHSYKTNMQVAFELLAERMQNGKQC